MSLGHSQWGSDWQETLRGSRGPMAAPLRLNSVFPGHSTSRGQQQTPRDTTSCQSAQHFSRFAFVSFLQLGGRICASSTHVVRGGTGVCCAWPAGFARGGCAPCSLLILCWWWLGCRPSMLPSFSGRVAAPACAGGRPGRCRVAFSGCLAASACPMVATAGVCMGGGSHSATAATTAFSVWLVVVHDGGSHW